METMRLALSYCRFTYRIALLLTLLILGSVQARGIEDKIVFISKRNFTPEVFLVEGLNGRPIQLTRNMFASWPSISPDGTEVVFVSRPPGGLAYILQMHLASNRTEILTDNGQMDAK